MVDVYLDAVFFPRCVEDFQIFQQEGWHFELNDPSEDITYKGFMKHYSYLFILLRLHIFELQLLCISIFSNDVLFVVPGVVFNEMKGVYSQPDNILGRAAQQASFLMACPFLIFMYFAFRYTFLDCISCM